MTPLFFLHVGVFTISFSVELLLLHPIKFQYIVLPFSFVSRYFWLPLKISFSLLVFQNHLIFLTLYIKWKSKSGRKYCKWWVTREERRCAAFCHVLVLKLCRALYLQPVRHFSWPQLAKNLPLVKVLASEVLLTCYYFQSYCYSEC